MGQKWDKSTPPMPKPSFHRVIEMCAHEGGDYTLTFVSTSADGCPVSTSIAFVMYHLYSKSCLALRNSSVGTAQSISIAPAQWNN